MDFDPPEADEGSLPRPWGVRKFPIDTPSACGGVLSRGAANAHKLKYFQLISNVYFDISALSTQMCTPDSPSSLLFLNGNTLKFKAGMETFAGKDASGTAPENTRQSSQQ
ncbi:MAG: hypothetical protein JRJ66_10835 [Deltaproteobacteria bacterium]|nr:hypothetical protein [Deltaproteobacteria bacterium]